jgi:hypothetical protein
MIKKDACPAIGSLVRIHHYMNDESSIYLGSMDENSTEDTPIECGTLALVIGVKKRGSQNEKSEVPIVLIGNEVGWIFCDEWDLVES